MRKAFTLIEIMVAVAILMILITLAIHNILRSRIVANEGAVLASLKVLYNACQAYNIDKGSYPDALSDLIVPASNPPYIDPALASGYRDGYNFVYSLSGSSFAMQANPVGILKGRYFYVDETGVFRTRTDSPAGPNDEILQ